LSRGRTSLFSALLIAVVGLRQLLALVYAAPYRRLFFLLFFFSIETAAGQPFGELH